MSKSLTEIQKDLKEFFEENKSQNIRKAEEDVLLNSKIFELETYLAHLKKESNININLNPTIVSESILKSFENVNPNQFHRPVDYQYPFLMWLFDNYNVRYSLHEHIDMFIHSIREFLKYPDIKITDTGATRCKTNVRMTVIHLRRYGILMNQNEDGKRTHYFSAFGSLLAAFLKLDREDFRKTKFYDEFENLQKPGELRYHDIDQRIYSCIKRLKTHDGFTELWNRLSVVGFSAPELKMMRSYLSQYIDLLLEGFEVTMDGIKEKESEGKTVLEFIKQLEGKKDFAPLKSKIVSHFRNLK